MADKIIGETVGIELESEHIYRGSFPSSPLFTSTHDASVESELPSFNGISVETNLRDLGLRNATFGTEIVSGLINTEKEYLSTLKSLTNNLISLGEREKSYRAGFHVHVNTPYNLKVLKSIMRLGRHLEQVFFLLGGMGYDYRGKQNDSIYCRPITKNGPICVHIYPRSFGQCFTLKDLLVSSTVSEFKERYGDLDYLNPRVGRYLPVRYHWLNLKPMFEQGSLEFRVFNKSLNPHFLWAVIEFCKAFVFYVMRSSFETLKEEGLIKENSVYDVQGEKDREKIIDTFKRFVSISGLDNKPLVVEILLDILHQSDINSIVLPNEPTFTHLMEYNGGDRCPRHWEHDLLGGFEPTKITRNLIKRPTYVDLYNQRSRQSPTIQMPADLEESLRQHRQRMLEERRLEINNYTSVSTATVNNSSAWNMPTQTEPEESEIEFFDDIMEDEDID